MALYQEIIHQLTAIYPQGEAAALVRLVMEERFGLSQTDLLLGKDSNLSANDRTELQNIVVRLLKNEPVQYILGYTTFCGLRIGVAEGVLIPRPETEELVEWIKPTKGAVLDIGTGSGCLALALASRGFEVEAWDVSDEALAIARQNAKQLGLSVTFRNKDILSVVSAQEVTSAKYDIIVSNPPYICEKEKKDMDANVIDYEPSIALFVPDSDPLLFYRAIARFATTALQPGGWLYFEINRAYAEETKKMLQSFGYRDIELRNDQFGNPRMIRTCRK